MLLFFLSSFISVINIYSQFSVYNRVDTQRIWNPRSKIPSEAESHVPERAVVVNVFEGVFPLTGSELDALCEQSNHDFILVFPLAGTVSLL